MLLDMHVKFEENLNIPVIKQLKDDRWITKFKKAYEIKEYHAHGEAPFVDLAAVEVEWVHLLTVLVTKCTPGDHFNLDGTSLFAL